MIKNLSQLYKELDLLLSGISDVCHSCIDDDCLGYIWLLPQEVQPLFRGNIELLEINGNINFINPFSDEEDIDIERYKPQCLYCHSRRCSIRDLRPLVCRLYPLNFIKEDNKLYVVLQLDCQFARLNKMIGFFNRVNRLFNRISPLLLKKILTTFLLVDEITKFPYGPNHYLKLFEIQCP